MAKATPLVKLALNLDLTEAHALISPQSWLRDRVSSMNFYIVWGWEVYGKSNSLSLPMRRRTSQKTTCVQINLRNGKLDRSNMFLYVRKYLRAFSKGT